MPIEDMAAYQRAWFLKKNSDPEWKAARNNLRAEQRRSNKTKAVQEKGGVCYDCGGNFPDCCYDFHHLNPLKDNEVPSNVLHCSWKRIEEMLNECVMLCSNCHRIRHNEDGYVAHNKR